VPEAEVVAEFVHEVRRLEAVGDRGARCPPGSGGNNDVVGEPEGHVAQAARDEPDLVPAHAIIDISGYVL
jgi:hypothetical protein